MLKKSLLTDICIRNIYNLITYKYLRILCANTELKTAYMHGTLFSF